MASGPFHINLIATSNAMPIGDTISALRDAMAYHTAVADRLSKQAGTSPTETAGIMSCTSMHRSFAVSIGEAIRRLHPLG